MTFHPIPVFGISEDVLFLIVFAVFGLIKYISSLHKKNEEPAPDTSDAEQAKRTREIQEEIRRRIAENQNKTQHAPRPEVQSKPVVNKPVMQRRDERPVPQHRERPDVIIGRQIDYMQQLAEARKAEEESMRRAREALASARLKTFVPTEGGSSRREGVLAMLHGGQSMRDAFIISEVLMPPVSERNNSSCPGLMQ